MRGKVAIVTGAGGGIGAAVSELFIREEAHVLLFEKNADLLEDTRAKLLSLGGGEAEACPGDVSDSADASRAVETAIRSFGRLDVLVNNAAIRRHSSVEASTSEDWQSLIAVNLLGAVNFCKAALPALRSNGGNIVNVSSCYAVVGRAGMPVYDATKAALLSLTRTLAFEEAPRVRVNAVCPGGTLTPFTIGRAVASGRKAEDMANDERQDSLLRRWARPMEVAYPILWLASDEGSYMTGANVMVDGGLSIM